MTLRKWGRAFSFTSSLTNKKIAAVAFCAAVSAMFAPGAAAMNAAVYVTNQTDNTVSVIDTSTNTVTKTVSVGVRPFGVAATPDGAHVYVANLLSNNVSVINTASNSIVTTIPTGSGPYWIAITPDGETAYVTNSGGNSVSVINTATNAVIATIPVGASPTGVTVNPAGTRVYVLNSDVRSPSVSVIDTATNTVMATVNTFGQPIQAAVTPDGSRVYISNVGGGHVAALNSASNAFTTIAIPVATPKGIDISPDGKRAYVAGGSGVSIIDTASNTTVSTIQAGSNPYGLALTSDGKTAYVANTGNSNLPSHTVSVVDTATNAVATVTVGNSPSGVAIATPPPPGTLTFYLHGADIPETAGGYTMNQTPPTIQGALLHLGLLQHASWFSDPTLTGTFSADATFKVTVRCTVGVTVLAKATLESSDANGGSVQSLGSNGALLSACTAGLSTFSIPVNKAVTLNTQRLKLTITNLLSLGLILNDHTFFQVTDFSAGQ